MSGSGGGSFLPRPKEAIKCSSIKFTTTLVRPVKEVLAKIKEQDLLFVNAKEQDIIVIFKSQLVGYIEVIDDNFTQEQFLQCIEGGTHYLAEVIDLNRLEDICKVKIYAHVL